MEEDDGGGRGWGGGDDDDNEKGLDRLLGYVGAKLVCS